MVVLAKKRGRAIVLDFVDETQSCGLYSRGCIPNALHVQACKKDLELLWG